MTKYFVFPAVLVALFLGHFVSANTAQSRHTVVGMLSLKNGEPAKLVVNPMNRSRYTLHVQNPELVARFAKKKDFSGMVRVEMDVLPKSEDLSPVKILKIERVHLRRVPIYDGDFKAVANGNG